MGTLMKKALFLHENIFPNLLSGVMCAFFYKINLTS